MLLAAFITAYLCACVLALPKKRYAAAVSSSTETTASGAPSTSTTLASTPPTSIPPTDTLSISASSTNTSPRSTLPTNAPMTGTLPSTAIPSSTSGGSTTVDLIFLHEYSVLIGYFELGRNQGLMIGTNSRNVALNHGAYVPANGANTTSSSQGGNIPIGQWLMPEYQYILCNDVMSAGAGGLEVTNQTFAYLDDGPILPLDGIFGLAYWPAFDNRTFFANLCVQHKLDSCTFSLTVDGDQGGTLVLGHNEQSLKEGAQTISIETDQIGWSVQGSMKYQYQGGPTSIENQTFFFSSERFYVMGNKDQVMEILNEINVLPILGKGNLLFPAGSMAYWSVPCQNVLPSFGFFFGSNSANSTDKFPNDFDPSAWNSTNGICYAPVVGWDIIPRGIWHLGQTWLRGKRVDFNLNDKSITIDGTASNAVTAAPSSQEDFVTIKMKKQDDYWLVDDVTVGGSDNLALRVDTMCPNLIMMPTHYERSNAGHGTNSTGQIGPLLPLTYECPNRSYSYTLDTDFFSMDGITAARQAVFQVPDATFYDDPGSGFDGILGFSGKDQSQGPPQARKSLLHSLCDQKTFQRCRFGVAVNTSNGASPGTGNSEGTLYLGGVNEDILDGALQAIPMDSSPPNLTSVYVAKVGQWWATGDIIIGGGYEAQMPFQDQNIYFNFASDKISGPSNQVMLLFGQLDSSYYRMNEISGDCVKHFDVYFDCNTPLEIDIQFKGVTGTVPLTTSSLNFGQLPGDHTMCSVGIEGRDDMEDYWSFGYPWFHRRYVDFNADDDTLNFAPLVNGALPASSQVNAASTASTSVTSFVTTAYLTTVITTDKLTATRITGADVRWTTLSETPLTTSYLTSIYSNDATTVTRTTGSTTIWDRVSSSGQPGGGSSSSSSDIASSTTRTPPKRSLTHFAAGGLTTPMYTTPLEEVITTTEKTAFVVQGFGAPFWTTQTKAETITTITGSTTHYSTYAANSVPCTSMICALGEPCCVQD